MAPMRSRSRPGRSHFCAGSVGEAAALLEELVDGHGVALSQAIIGLEPVGDLGRLGPGLGKTLFGREADEFIGADPGLLFDIGEIGSKSHLFSLSPCRRSAPAHFDGSRVIPSRYCPVAHGEGKAYLV